MFNKLEEPVVYILDSTDNDFHDIPVQVYYQYPELIDETSKYKSIDELLDSVNKYQEEIYQILVCEASPELGIPSIYYTHKIQLCNPYDIFNINNSRIGIFFDENDNKTIHIKVRQGVLYM